MIMMMMIGASGAVGHNHSVHVLPIPIDTKIAIILALILWNGYNSHFVEFL